LEQEETSSGFRFARRFFGRRSNAFDALSRNVGKRDFWRFSLFFPLLGGASATFFAFFSSSCLISASRGVILTVLNKAFATRASERDFQKH
jgi:hypothetical protein